MCDGGENPLNHCPGDGRIRLLGRCPGSGQNGLEPGRQFIGDGLMTESRRVQVGRREGQGRAGVVRRSQLSRALAQG